MQKIDRIAILVAAALILGTVAWTFFTPDPGAQLADTIRKHRDAIEDTRGEQSGVQLGHPEDLGERVQELFRPAGSGKFPEWTFYRRMATYDTVIREAPIPPVLTPGQVCKVEALREKGTPNRTFHRVRGVRAKAERAAITREALERRKGTDGEWVAVAPLAPGGEAEFEIDIEEGLERGLSYSYRLTVEAKSATGLEFAAGGLTSALPSDASEPMLFPEDRTFEFTGLQPGQLDPTAGTFLPGKATIKFVRWDWDKMDDDSDTAWVTEGDALLDSGYTVDQGGIREGKDGVPDEVRLSGSGLPRLTVVRGVKPSPIAPTAWESTHPACTGAAPEEEASGEPKPEEPKPKPAEGGGLFGDD
jgi:hypothetical protein